MSVFFFTVGLCIIPVICVIILLKSIVIVSTGEVILIESFGKYSRMLDPGIHFIKPFVESCRYYRWSCRQEDNNGRIYNDITSSYRISTQPTMFDFVPIQVRTVDHVNVMVNGVLWFQINDAYQAVYHVKDCMQALEQVVLTRLRERASNMKLDELMQSKGLLQMGTMNDITEAVNDWGIMISALEIQSLVPPKATMAATQASINARHKAEARLVEERAQREVALLQAQTERELATIYSNSEAEKLNKQAETEAKAIVQKANAVSQKLLLEAETVSRMVEALGGDSRTYVELQKAKALQELASKVTGTTFISDKVLGLQSLGSLFTSLLNNNNNNNGLYANATDVPEILES